MLDKHTSGGWRVSDSDQRSLDVTRLDVSQIKFQAFCGTNSEPISLRRKLLRLSSMPVVLLDAGIGFSLIDEKKHVTLEWLRENRGVSIVDFPGTRFESYDRKVCILGLVFRRHWDVVYWSMNWPTDIPSAVLSIL